MRNEKLAFLLGLIAVCGFSVGLPMARVAVTEFDPLYVGMGRAFVASILAAIYLLIVRAPIPKKKHTGALLSVGIGISVSFPYLSSIALQYVSASHAAIVTGLLPLSTAYWISLNKSEKPSKSFWIWSVLGCVAVVSYTLYVSGGTIHTADLLLLGTVVLGGMGYAYGALAAKEIGGINVMCWGLVYAFPLLACFVVPKVFTVGLPHVSITAWIAMAYLICISQLFGMMLWYKALSMGSIAKLSQIQLLQPFLTLIIAAIFGERVDWIMFLAATTVVFSIAMSRKSAVGIKASS
jgi:drug/metabolite transporter (DMT)-like permease